VPASTRRALGAVVAALGIVFVVLGAWMVVILGPSGEAQFSATSKAPGAVVIPPEVLNAVDSPVRISATRSDGGSLSIATAPSTDARAILGTSTVTTVSAVQFPDGALVVHGSGKGALTDLNAADIWRLAAKSAGTAELVVDQGRAPETAVVTSGDTTALNAVTVTLTWANRAWFFEALAMATIGALVAAFALNDLWQGRVLAVRRDIAEPKTSEATV
jgi:hypothetical protein